jgi:hypothetical protein
VSAYVDDHTEEADENRHRLVARNGHHDEREVSRSRANDSTFATVRLRQRVAEGRGSRSAGVAMAFMLIESAQTRWRAVIAPHLVALVRAGAAGKSASSSDDPRI